MSSQPAPELQLDRVQEPFNRWFQVQPTALERIGGGRNSQVYKVTAAGKETDTPLRFALKLYFRHAADQRDRLATEYNSFSHLWANGIRVIPRPLAFDPTLGWAVYEFIDGVKLSSRQVRKADVQAAVEFLDRLRQLSHSPESRKLAMASEAQLAPSQVASHVRSRLARLQAAPQEAGPCQALHKFLSKDFCPLLETITGWSDGHLRAAGVDPERELSWDQRTLSPSDFGFHNALRQPDGRIIFLDFEYFGWDDPAKMIADFLLHPAVRLSRGLRKAFATAILDRFADWPGLPARVEALYPLFGLKWCMIFLNEFLPEALLRRQFAAITAADQAKLQRQQLQKARRMLRQIGSEFEHFPYRD